ncbi:carboxypeptidase regulatory-like domain-containing protein [Alteromonas portus]|uniref:Carboxypeptidase regulatory-like domain-containing protein n=1 Tax=Alteromonas portus TaxID=2565549 RepID=A0A4U0ZEX3_9ALTE|nr:Ig-like domain-containing protein [Alteromonas portus]TKB01470.1 carboxypeptidase regulatory-like domain-containing protein [Alteromonas portus]
MMKKSLIALVVSATFLAACGGSDDKNELPVLSADVASTLNGESITIDVLANDTDPDGDTLSISAVGEPSSGEVSIVSNALVYTPPLQAMGDVTFSYDVTDGEETVSSTVTITNEQQITIAGIATDAPLSNGTVTATSSNGDVLATVTTDASGMYTLPIKVSADPGNLVLSAVGVEEQSHVSLMSRVGAFSSLLSLATENQTSEITDGLLPDSKITHISTAKAVLYNQYLADGGVESFNAFTTQVDFDEVIGLASFIKLLADNEDFPLDDGVNTLTFFTQSEDDVLGSIREYLDSLGLIEEDGSFSESYIEAVNTARAETLEDETLKISYTNADVAGSEFVIYDGGNFQAVKGEKVLTFNSEGNGVLTSSDSYANNIVDAFSWEIENGKIKLTFPDAAGTVTYSFLTDELLAHFDEDTQAELLELESIGFINQWQLTRRIVSSEISLVSVNDSNAFASEVNTYNLSLTDASGGYTQTFDASVTEPGEMSYHNGNYIQLTNEDVTNSPWVLNIQDVLTIDHPFEESSTITGHGMIADSFTFNANGTYESLVTGETGMWTVEEGALQFQYGDTTFKLSPFKQHNDYLLALLEFADEGNTVKYSVDMHKVRGTVDTTQLVSELPVAWLSYIFDHDGPNGLPLYNDVFGYYFLQNGTAGRIYPSSAEEEASFTTDYDTYNWQWAVVDNVVSIEGQIGGGDWMLRRKRQWHVLGETEDGRMMVIENFIFYWDEQNPYADFILPRLNFYKKLDLEILYPEQWARFSASGGMGNNESTQVSISYSSQSLVL